MHVTILSKSVEYSLLAVVDPHLQVSRGQNIQIYCHFGIFLEEISTQLLKQVQSSRIFLTFYELKL